MNTNSLAVCLVVLTPVYSYRKETFKPQNENIIVTRNPNVVPAQCVSVPSSKCRRNRPTCRKTVTCTSLPIILHSCSSLHTSEHPDKYDALLTFVLAVFNVVASVCDYTALNGTVANWKWVNEWMDKDVEGTVRLSWRFHG